MTIAHDVNSNGYRDLILPLAHEDPLVQRAVMVVSALHLGNQQKQLRQQAEMGRAAIFARLRQDVMRGSVEDVLSVSTWATLLILLVGETVTGSSDFVHLFNMLRSLMSLQNGHPLGSQDLSTFLDYQRRMYVTCELARLSAYLNKSSLFPMNSLLIQLLVQVSFHDATATRRDGAHRALVSLRGLVLRILWAIAIGGALSSSYHRDDQGSFQDGAHAHHEAEQRTTP